MSEASEEIEPCDQTGSIYGASFIYGQTRLMIFAMKTTIRLSLKDSIPQVKIGDKINEKTAVCQSVSANDTVIHLNHLLKVKQETIPKYLKISIGQAIHKDNILAEKKSLFSTLTVRSPHDGELKEINLKDGTLIISRKETKLKEKQTIPVKGIVKDINHDHIEIEIEGVKVKGKKGGGSNQVGELFFIAGDSPSFLDIDAEVEERIVLVKQLTANTMVKIDALGALACITEKVGEQMTLPYLVVEADSFLALKKHHSERAWLRPENLEVIIL